MSRLSVLLMLALVGCALSVVTSQHQARKLFVAIETEQENERRLNQEFRELQLENQTLAAGRRIEQKAVHELGMRVPDAKKTVIVVLNPTATGEAK